MLRILVADDHAVVRKGLKQIISDLPDTVVIDEADNGQEVLNKVLHNDYDAVVLDITMPGRSGLDLLKDLKGQRPELQILILSIHPEEHYAKRALSMGASGYLSKESAPEELINALQKVLSGGRYVSSALAEKLAFHLEAAAEKPLHEVLSDREYQVMLLIAAGKSAKDIAEELFLSVKTINTFRSRLLQKMHMKSNAELIRYAVQNRLVQ